MNFERFKKGISYFVASLFLCCASKGVADEAVSSELPKKRIIIPFGYYTPETKLAAGVLAIQNFGTQAPGKTSSVLSSASLTVLGQSIFNIAPRFYFEQGKYELGGLFFYSYFPSKYYGQGLRGTLDEPESFLENTLISNLNGGIQFIENFYLRGSFSYETRRSQKYEVSGKLDQEVQYKNLGAYIYTLNLDYDKRDLPQAPTRGHLYRFSASWINPFDRDNGNTSLSSFEKYEVDGREYLPLADDFVWAHQLLASEVHSEQYVPFQYLNSIGGANRMRGFYNGRYREKALLLYQTEGRWQFKDRWVAAVFGGASRLSDKFESIFKGSDSRLFASGGFGVHYIIDPENRTKFRFDIGLGAEKLGVYVIVGEAF